MTAPCILCFNVNYLLWQMGNPGHWTWSHNPKTSWPRVLGIQLHFCPFWYITLHPPSGSHVRGTRVPQCAELQKYSPGLMFPPESIAYTPNSMIIPSFNMSCNSCLELPSKFAGAYLIWILIWFEFDFIGVVQFCRKLCAMGGQQARVWHKEFIRMVQGGLGTEDRDRHSLWPVWLCPGEG